MNPPSEHELRELPGLALVALAARIARRVQPLFSVLYPYVPPAFFDPLEQAISEIEQVAASHVAHPQAIVSPSFERVLGDLDAMMPAGTAEDAYDSLAACWVIDAAAKAARAVLETDQELAKHVAAAAQSAYWGTTGHVLAQTEIHEGIRQDFALLVEAAQLSGWQHKTAVPPQFFSLRSQFDKATDARGSMIELTSFLDERLLKYFHENPKHLFLLTPRQFEELIADLFVKFGFEVDLTQRTRDGGADIIAVSHRVVRVKYLIECKRYAEHRRVGVQTVRSLHGVVVDDRATKGILATTARFTGPATEFIERNKWVLEGRDFDGLLDWLDIYQNFRMKKPFGLV